MDDRESVTAAIRAMADEVRTIRERDAKKALLDREELEARLDILAAGQDVIAQWLGALVRTLPVQPRMPVPDVAGARPVRPT